MEIVEYEDLEEGVFDSILKMLLRGRIKPGDKLNQLDLARELSASRTPINAVLSHLEGMMIVEKRPRRGYFIPHYEKDELENLFFLFELLGTGCLQELTGRKHPGNRALSSLLEEKGRKSTSSSGEIIYSFFTAFTGLSGNRFLEHHFSALTVSILITGRIHTLPADVFLPGLKSLASALEDGTAREAQTSFRSAVRLLREQVVKAAGFAVEE